MLAYYQVGAFSLLLVGFAFGLVWAVDRTNKAALNWMIAHLALGFAVISGIRPAAQSNAWLDLIALLLTGLFLAAMYAALCNIRGLDFDIGHILPMTMGFALAISIIGFGYSTFAGHLFILSVLAGFFVWSGWVFLHKLSMPWVGLAFFLRSSSYVVLLTNGKFLFTAEQSLPTYVFSWSTAVFLGLVLIYVAVRQSRHRLEQIIRHLPDALLVKESDGSVLLCNQRFADLAGVKNPADLNGRPAPNFWADREQGEQIDASVAAPERLAEPLRMESEIHPEHGEKFPAEVIYSQFMDWGKPIVVTQIRDISERKAAEEERLSLLSTDQLTGLPNRQSLEWQLNAILWEQTRNHLGCAAMIISLDNFEKINDAFGHAMGDSVLREAARVLNEIKDQHALLARIEGTEFALVMTHLDIRSQLLQVDALAKAVTARLGRQILQNDVSVMLGTSIGIALSHPGDIRTTALLQRAQIAVHEAKGQGKWRFYDDDMDARMVSALKIESALREASANNELYLHYQPIVDAHSGRIAKVEALARWKNPAHGNVSPTTFIPIAEQSALILDIGFWIMNEAIRQAASWAAGSTDAPTVGINVSVRQFMHEEFEERLNSAVSSRGISPSLIDLEITESLFASSDNETLRNKFDRLRACGYGLLLDDFGTGYSSLSYLARFKLSAVKIDRSFVSGVDEDTKKRSIVRAIVSMSQSLGLKVIAEGVETEEERRILLDEGCDLFQGFLFSRPVAPDLLHFGKR